MSTTHHDARRLWTAAGGLAGLVATLLGLSGCQATGALSTAASMHVEVDVYKGALGSGKTVQLGELAAVFDQADLLLQRFARDANAMGNCNKAFFSASVDGIDRLQVCDMAARAESIRGKVLLFPTSPKPADDRLGAKLKELSGAAAVIIEYQKARAAGEPRAAAEAAAMAMATAAAEAASQPQINNVGEAGEILKLAVMDASRLSTQLKIEAFYWSEAQIGHITANPAVRTMIVNYVNLTSELANQISARTVAIDKQLDRSVAGNALSLSDHLKEAGPSDFLHLYDWYQASQPDTLSEGPERLSPQARVRLAKRLFSDHYWTRINDVHASGQGEVRMAVIKDDIGNWNLKSFDNDAEKLLGAYRDLTMAGIAAGIRVAKDVGTGGGAAGLELASQFARGRLGSTQTSTLNAQRIDAMRASVAANLEAIRADAAAEEEKQKSAEDAASRTLDERKGKTKEAEGAVKKASSTALPAAQSLLAEAKAQEAAAAAQLDTVQAQRREKMAVAFENARREIDVHRRVIASLKEFQVTPPSTPTTSRTLSNALQP